MAVHHINSPAEFQALLSNNKHVVADFYADWCPPCKAIAPMYVRLAETASSAADETTSAPGVAFAKINVDHQQAIAQQYGITAMPTFVFFKDGKVDSGKPTIRGADPRGLSSAVEAVKSDADKEQKKRREEKKKAEAKEKEGEAKKEDTETVSGGYSMTTARNDWKMSLRG